MGEQKTATDEENKPHTAKMCLGGHRRKYRGKERTCLGDNYFPP